MQREKIHVLLCVDILGAAAQRRLFNCRLVLSGLSASGNYNLFRSHATPFPASSAPGVFCHFPAMDGATWQLDGAGVLIAQISQKDLIL